MEHRVFGKSDIGRRHDHNEDAMLIDPDLGLYMVCDGVGGQAAGEIASQTTCDTVREHLRRHTATLEMCRHDSNLFNRDRALELVKDAILAANEKVYKMAQDDPDKQGMACTIVLLLVLGPHAVVAHAGDSRVYLVRQGEIYQLTEDHTAANEQLKKGLITPEQARRSRHGSLITRAVGGQEQFLAVDTLFIELMSHDKFLLCSDGLTSYLDGPELLKRFMGSAPEKLPQQLVDVANERGGHDNITAVIAAVGEADAQADAEVARKFDVLKQIPLFEYLNYMELMKVLNITGVAAYKEGDVVISEDEKDNRLYVCLTGSVRVVKQEEVIAELGTGSFFGEMSLIDKGPRSADVIAAERSSMIYIDRENFFGLVTREPRLAVKLLWPMCRVLNQRLRETSAELAWSRSQMPEGGDDIADALQFLSERRM